MKRRRLFGTVLSLALAASLVLSAVSSAASAGALAKVDQHRPVPATDVELVKKVTVRRAGPPIVPPGAGGKKKTEPAATGILGASVTGDRYAVVVGISDYPGDDMDLAYADDDATDMAQALSTVYGFTNVTLLKDLNATRDAILDAIDDIPTDAGEVVFFYSGHGSTGLADDGDREKKDEAIAVVSNNGLGWSPIWDGELAAAFDGLQRVVLVFDTCYAGGMQGDLQAPGRVIAMATTENGLSYEGPDWENGEFTHYFVDHGTDQGLANVHDYNADGTLHQAGQVTVEEAFDYAKANCTWDKPTIGDYFDNDLFLGT